MSCSTPEQFWKLVEQRETYKCWIWQDRKDKFGYGRCWYQKQNWICHRLAWTLTYGEIPKGLLVCHHCDIPACCNPGHLFVGTTQDNVDDRVKKNRDNPNRGDKSNFSKLTNAQVLEIRKLGETKLTQQVIANRYGVYQSTIARILLNQTWNHI